MKKAIDLSGLSRFLEQCKQIFVKKNDIVYIDDPNDPISLYENQRISETFAHKLLQVNSIKINDTYYNSVDLTSYMLMGDVISKLINIMNIDSIIIDEQTIVKVFTNATYYIDETASDLRLKSSTFYFIIFDNSSSKYWLFKVIANTVV